MTTKFLSDDASTEEVNHDLDYAFGRSREMIDEIIAEDQCDPRSLAFTLWVDLCVELVAIGWTAEELCKQIQMYAVEPTAGSA